MEGTEAQRDKGAAGNQEAGFALKEGDAIGSPALGRYLGQVIATEQGRDPKALSDQTIRNYVAQGMPHRRVGPKQKVLRFDARACEQWVRRNKLAGTAGGRRRGAGRKRKDPGKGTPTIPDWEAGVDREYDRESARRRIKDIEEGKLDSDRLMLDEALLKLSRRDIEIIAYLDPEISGFTVNQATRLKQLHDAKSRALQLAQREGELGPVAEFEAKWGEHIEVIRRMLEGAGKELAPRVAEELGQMEQAAVIRAVIEAWALRKLAELAGD